MKKTILTIAITCMSIPSAYAMERIAMPEKIRNICAARPSDDYHCTQLRNTFICALLTHKNLTSQEVKEFCKHRIGIGFDYGWNATYHTNEITKNMPVEDALLVFHEGKVKLESFGVNVFEKK